MEKMSNERPTFAKLWADVKKHKKLYYKVLSLTFIVAAFLMLSIPSYYRCQVMLAPELSGLSGKSSPLASIASSFGISLGSSSAATADALIPTLYPDLINSVNFKASLFPIKVQREEDNEESDTLGVVTYYDYLKDGQKKPWWSAAIKWTIGGIRDGIASLLGIEKIEKDNSKVNPFKLTKEQDRIVKAMEKKVVCDVDKKTMVITIDVKDQDPLIAATMADSVKVRLQNYITDYRTSKARVNQQHYQRLCVETKERYDKACREYAAYADSNQKLYLQTKRTKLTELENEMNMQYRAYSQMVAQLQLADAKVQEATPAFTELQPATVPLKKAGPARTRTCLIFLFLAFVATTAYILHKEGDLIPLLTSGDDDDEEED